MSSDQFDDQFDEWVREVARDYNRPADRVPREEMWQAIVAARAASHPPALSARRRSWLAPADWRIAAAAVLLVGTGIGIGYVMRGSAPVAPNVATETPSPDEPAGITTYDVATAEHLTSAEVLLTTFQAASDAESVEAAQRWARNLLSTTRLLLDSPAAVDPERRRLFEDLERILVQIVQLPADAPAAERAYVERVISRDAMLTRIRTTIPAGVTSGS